MRLLIDANIVLDVLQKREPHFKDSAAVWKICETEQAEGYISALTFANLVYVMRKELNPDQIRDVLKNTGITATAGIGTNLYLAKVAMDIVAKKAKPDADGVRIAALCWKTWRMPCSTSPGPGR